MLRSEFDAGNLTCNILRASLMGAVGLGHKWGDESTSLAVANLPAMPKGCLQKRASKDCWG
eukprot:2096919-Pyramimonas_sp.AAC.2